jgi:hypothetical protein
MSQREHARLWLVARSLTRRKTESHNKPLCCCCSLLCNPSHHHLRAFSLALSPHPLAINRQLPPLLPRRAVPFPSRFVIDRPMTILRHWNVSCPTRRCRATDAILLHSLFVVTDNRYTLISLCTSPLLSNVRNTPPETDDDTFHTTRVLMIKPWNITTIYTFWLCYCNDSDAMHNSLVHRFIESFNRYILHVFLTWLSTEPVE